MKSTRPLFINLLSAFAVVYRVLAWATLVFIAIGAAGCAWEATQGNRDAVISYVSSGIILIIADVRFFVWRKICAGTLAFMSGEGGNSLLRKVSKFFVWSFLLDVLRLIYLKLVPLESPDWSVVLLPHYSGNVAVFIHDWMSYLFKITVIWDGFLTPTTVGLSSLFLSLLCKCIAERSEAPIRN
jgi:hypothetical protein